jgi:hypothetical protein
MFDDEIECLVRQSDRLWFRLTRFPIISVVPPLSSTSIELNSYYFPSHFFRSTFAFMAGDGC